MATRPVFVVRADGRVLAVGMPVEFAWHAGMAKSRKQKCIRSLHEAARGCLRVTKPLEVSSKSELPLGVRLSAFNLRFATPDGAPASVEVLFQGGKVFADGGPYVDLYSKPPVEAKKDPRLQASGELLAFRYGDTTWPLEPKTAFYDWLYVSALAADETLAAQVVEFDAFTDIEFNPARSINCQARSAALFKALVQRGRLQEALSSWRGFLDVLRGEEEGAPAATTGQMDLL